MNWTCDLIEARLSDYLEGLLDGPERVAFEAHAKSCADCAPLVASVRSLVGEMHSMEVLETPPRLVYAILDKTLGPRETVTGWQGFLNVIRGLATPKLAYGAASVMATTRGNCREGSAKRGVSEATASQPTNDSIRVAAGCGA